MTAARTGPRRVGVLVRPGRAAEGLRMASALPLCDNAVEVLLLGDHLPDTGEIAVHLDTLDLTESPVLAAFTDPRVTTISPAAMAARLTGYDHVLTF